MDKERIFRIAAPPGWRQALLGAAALGALSTVGDWIWARWLPHGAGPTAGLAHGVLLFLFLGLMLGLFAGNSRAVLRGLVWAPLIGLVSAAAFYLFYRWTYAAAMFLAWMLAWLLFGLLWNKMKASAEPVGRALMRGALAAILSGAAFYAISGIWTHPDPGGPNYLKHFLYWTFAFYPGFLSLLQAIGSLDPKVIAEEP